MFGIHNGGFPKRFEALFLCREASQYGHTEDVIRLVAQKRSSGSVGDRRVAPALGGHAGTWDCGDSKRRLLLPGIWQREECENARTNSE